mmetsp:Transcript_125765/g.230776  ORF Transcript_125765/g.230776 Transcript_125765/m.230776 type:complete len:294 (-) Transcript_125765:165-1046(-)
MSTMLPRNHMSASRRLSEKQDHDLMDRAVHTKHKDYAKLVETLPKREYTTRVLKKKVIVPVEETVKVPVYRKEARRKTEKVVVQGTTLVPVTRYKEVEETVLDVEEEIENGHAEKRAAPVTRIRQIPYQDFEEKIVDVEVEVPADEVVQRTGYRIDKHVVSKVVEVEQDHVYEMRPILVAKGEKRMKEVGEHHTFKKEHGPPHWEVHGVNHWRQRPVTPEHRPDLPRPSSARSIHSDASSMVVPRLKETTWVGPASLKSPSYTRPHSASGRPASASGRRSFSATRIADPRRYY